MVSRFLKKTLGFSALAAAVFAFIVSCENPFTNNLGEKVDVEPPTISVTAPRSGSLLDGTIVFEGIATAYRDLRSVEVRIYDKNDVEYDGKIRPILDWVNITTDSKGTLDGGAKQKNWTYTLDTTTLEDGFLKIQFRARDPNLVAPGEVMVYTLKNGPSIINLTEPPQSMVDSWENEERPQTLFTNMYIRGSVRDGRGIMPGYPMIKIWRDGEAEPDDKHWGTLFLSGLDDPDMIDPADYKGGTYTDRSDSRVVNAAAFQFRLAEFTVDPLTNHIRYTVTPDSGNYMPLKPGDFRFRIKTSETYFYEDEKDPLTFMTPRDSDPLAGEVVIIGYKPDIEILNMSDPAEIARLDKEGKSYRVSVITTGVLPTIELDNEDVKADLDKVPHIYMEAGTSRKIARETNGIKDFRLQVLAHHDETIRRAILQYDHTGSKHRSGYLMWDDWTDDGKDQDDTLFNGYYRELGQEGQVLTNAQKSEQGHYGRSKDKSNPSAGKLFTFTADGALTDEFGDRLFVSSTEPYYLTVTAYSVGGLSKTQKYTLYLDGSGPTINILGVRGAAEEPISLGDSTTVPGSILNDSPYDVNGNIQVSVVRSANMGISSVKWIVEDDAIKGATPNYLNAANTTLAKLKTYKANPTAGNFAFYDNIKTETAMQGIVKEPIDSPIAMDKLPNLKFSTAGLNNKDLWLYIIAEDNVHNLNFVLQKLHVNEDGDKPTMTLQGIEPSTSIGSLQALYDDVVNTTANKQGRTNENGLNILSNSQAITITLKDDDGISTTRTGDVSITLTRSVVSSTGTVTDICSGTIPASAFLSGRTYLETGNSRELGGSLSPEVMAKALYSATSTPPFTGTAPKVLDDGLYKLEIEVKDNNSLPVKVSMSATVPAAQATTGKQTYFFAVKSQPPVITLDDSSPQQNSVMGQGTVTISGKVESPFQIQKLEITFSPDVVTPALPATKTLLLYPTAAAATAGTGAIGAFTGTHTGGMYTYYWRIANVNFSNVPSDFSPLDDVRKFDIVATDGLNGTGDSLNTVRVDSEPPKVMLAEFNFGRSTENGVNGKVPIDISVSDNNGIQIDTDGTVHVKWWVLPSTSAVPNWDTAFPTGQNGAGGQFTTANDRGGGVYRAVVNTILLSNAPSYYMYAIAKDRAGNLSGTTADRLSSAAFTLNQDGDYPTLGDDLSPKDNEQRGAGDLIIKGTIMDDDWFELNTARAGGYLEIQFPSAVNTSVTPTVPTAWPTTWIKIGYVAGNDNSIKVGTGEAVEFEYDASGNSYFDTQGWKFYRLRLTDEQNAGAIALGKNPDGEVPQNPNGNGGNDKYLLTLQSYYPSASANHSTPATVVTDCYRFLYKSDVPEVYFQYYDPNDTHPGHTQGTSGPIAAGSRPAFSNTDPVAGLKAALQGGYIREAELQNAWFTYGNGDRQAMTIGTVLKQDTTYPDRWYWNTSDAIWNTFLAGVAGSADGTQNIFIEAYDSLGQLGSVQWSFNKDNTAPRIDFTNVSETEVKVIRGNSGEDVFVKGRFVDTASDIDPYFMYQFFRGTGGTATAVGTPANELIELNGELTGVSASWAAKVPGEAFNDSTFPDGKHTFRVRAADVSGNWTKPATPVSGWNTVEFIVDRVPPEMSVADDMLVDVFGQTNAKLPAAERVFSGLSATPATGAAFTLKGLVYEHNLAGFTATIGTLANTSIRLRITDATTPAPEISYNNGTTWTTPTTSQSTISVRSAELTDLGPFNATSISNESINHLYVWSVTLRNGDLSSLPTLAPNDSYRVSVQAQDLANRGSAPKEWVFALDGTAPTVSFYNELTTTPQQSFNVQGQAKDNTFVKAVYYNIQKWDYAAATPGWRYFNGNASAPAWNATTPLGGTNQRNWPNLLEGQQPKDEMYFTLNSTTLADSYRQNAAGSKDLPEGRYRLTLYVTDTSLSNTAATNGNPTTVTPEFYVDRNEPVVTWVSTQQNFYRTAGSGVTLQFKATDAANTIDTAGSTASIKLGAAAATSLTPTFAAVSGDIYSQIVTVTIPNTVTTSGTYTLSLSIKDMAGQTSTSANFDIKIDNTAPGITMTPASGSTAAVTGRVQFKGEFSKLPNESPVNRVAFWVASTTNDTTFTTPANLTEINAGTQAVDDAYLKANGWHFYESATSDQYQLAVGTGGSRRVLMEMEDGTSTVNFIIPNTRNFQAPTNTGHLSIAGQTAGGTLTFNGKGIISTFGSGEIVHKIRIYILARDEAGNRKVEECDYWIYPAGDYPIISKVSKPDPASPAAERLMNGRILISGTATDNVRVNRVWFRAVDSANPNGIRLSGIPIWDETTWEAKTGAGSGDQTPQTITPYGGTASDNWYMASGGGSQTVPWWAYINNEGELDPLLEGSREINIEVVAEDTSESSAGVWETTGLIGRVNVPANPTAVPSTPAYPILTLWVVKDAPRFEREMIANDKSSEYISGPAHNYTEAPVGTAGWKNILTSAVRQRASYSVTVRHPELLRSLHWDRGDSTIDLLDAANEYNATTYGTDIANMNLATPTGPGIAVKVNNRASPRLLNGYYEYDVVVDFHTALLRLVLETGTPNEYNFVTTGGTAALNTASGFFKIKLTATESSKSVPLTQRHTASIPIDNLKPVGMYTHSSSVVGSNATFGGVAGDKETPSGLEKVVMWFSKPRSGAGTAGDPYKYENVSWSTLNGAVTAGTTPDGLTLPAGVTVPAEGGANSVVIDRNDPMGNQSHHGSQLSMGFANVGGEMGTSWYVVLDSGNLEAGAKIAHFIVYDKAGNASYYSQKLMILNGLPQITQIKLGTDIMMRATPILGTGNTATSGTTGNKLATIRTTNSAGTTDPQHGISEYIPINPVVGSSISSLNKVYSVVSDQPFNVRNRLLAMEIDVDTIAGSSSNKTQRHFRVEYVSGARSVSGTGTAANQIRNATTGIRAGRVYMINDPGSTVDRFPWGSLGAKGDEFVKGFVFLAIEDGSSLTDLSTTANYGTPSVWELNGSYYTSNTNPLARTVPPNLQLADVNDTKTVTADLVKSAEFVYGQNAFSATGATFTANTNATQIMDFNPVANADGRPAPYLTSTANPWEAHSLFIIRVFDGTEDELFGDFALLSIRVNNNDKTKPYAQMYDLNPMTEGVSTNNTTQANAVSPQGMGQNRTKGGLYNTGTASDVAKSGHIEPRTGTSLNSLQMGGAASANAATINRPMANPAAYFTTDTVSGEVILRGYVEDDQRIKRVDLQFYSGTEGNTTAGNILATVPILVTRTAAATADKIFLDVPSATASPNGNGRVDFTETIDLNRHRVEWTYRWNTEAVPGGANVVGNINVRALAYNNNSTENTAAANEQITFSALTDANRKTYDYYNPDFPESGTVVGSADNGGGGTAVRYNDIRVNIRPYITGFLRNQNDFNHNTRSRQGRYMFRRNEAVVITGFNLLNGGAASATNRAIISLATAPTGNNSNLADVGTIGNYGIATANNTHYRQFTVYSATTGTTGNGVVTLSVNGQNAVNTSGERPGITANNRPTAIQPWNIEYNAAKDGSTLWDDFTSVHIWKSDNNTDNYDQGQFKVGDRMNVGDPAMSIHPDNGILYASHTEQGGNGNNSATAAISSNRSTNTARVNIAAFCDPIRHTDIFVSNSGTVWSTYSIIGKQGGGTAWTTFGGVFMAGATLNNNAATWAGGGNPNLTSGLGQNNQYIAESTWYNASTQGSNPATPPPTDQFHNPHIVVYREGNTGTTERMHVSYYDEKDKSIKYRYNLRDSPGTVNGNTAVRAWINLDGGVDNDDTVAVTNTNAPFVNTAAGARVVGYTTNAATTATNRASKNAGLHNSIGITSQGYPVVVYFDETNQQLKMAVSNDVAPRTAANWKIFASNDIFNNADRQALYQFGTGEYVSMAINPSNNDFHIAALNSTNQNLVYIRGRLNVNTTLTNYTLTINSIQVVDSVGVVGRWCNVSLDSSGNPWISYHDASYRGSRDGVKVAYLNTTRFTKGATGTTYADQDIDIYGTSVTGWETMHVPTAFRVEDARLGMERFPTIRNTNATKGNGNGLQTFGAVGYLGEDRYRIAYYVD